MGVFNWICIVLFMKYVVDVFDVLKMELRFGFVVEGRMFYVVVDFNRIIKKKFLFSVIGLILFLFGD